MEQNGVHSQTVDILKHVQNAHSRMISPKEKKVSVIMFTVLQGLFFIFCLYSLSWVKGIYTLFFKIYGLHAFL